MFDRTGVCWSKSSCAFENRGERIIVGLEDRIKFMIVASNTTERHSQKRLTDRIELLVDGIHDQLFAIWFRKNFGTKDQETGTGFGFLIAVGEQVTGQLFGDKRIDRFVRIERLDNVIAISPSVSESDIFVEAVRVGISGYVQPVPSPSHSVLRRS